MWLCNSSIGRKVVMSITGVALILFLTFHGCMNLVALFSEEGYNISWCQLVCSSGYYGPWRSYSDSHCLRVYADSPEP